MKKPKPIQQSGLDSLCSLFTVVNLVKLLKGISKNECYSIFNNCLEIIEKRRGSLLESITEGLYDQDFYHLLRVTTEYYNIQYHKPFHRCKGVSLETVWTEISCFLSKPHRCVIICYDVNGYGHCTIVNKASEKCFFLFDSNGGQLIRKSQSTIPEYHGSRPCCHYPYHTIFLSLEDDKRG